MSAVRISSSAQSPRLHFFEIFQYGQHIPVGFQFLGDGCTKRGSPADFTSLGRQSFICLTDFLEVDQYG